jgi:hypothetical protein
LAAVLDTLGLLQTWDCRRPSDPDDRRAHAAGGDSIHVQNPGKINLHNRFQPVPTI